MFLVITRFLPSMHPPNRDPAPAGALPARLRLAVPLGRGRARGVRLPEGLPARPARAARHQRAVAGLHGRGQAARPGRRQRRRTAGRQPAAAAQQGHARLPRAASAEVSLPNTLMNQLRHLI